MSKSRSISRVTLKRNQTKRTFIVSNDRSHKRPHITCTSSCFAASCLVAYRVAETCSISVSKVLHGFFATAFGFLSLMPGTLTGSDPLAFCFFSYWLRIKPGHPLRTLLGAHLEINHITRVPGPLAQTHPSPCAPGSSCSTNTT